MMIDQENYDGEMMKELAVHEIESSSSSTEELNLFITKDQADTVAAAQEPVEILESDSAPDELPSSDSSFETNKKRKQYQPITTRKRGKIIRKPASCLVPKTRPRPGLELRIVNRKSLKEPDFQCKTCREVFPTGQALGGHMSRVHPGQSTSYAKKLQRRDERSFDRELLRLAKIMHSEEHKGKDVAIDRVKIRRFKKQIRAAVLKGQKYVAGLSVRIDQIDLC